MKHDLTAVMVKHIKELYQILDKYNISDRLNFISTAETDLVLQKAVLMSVGYIGELSKKLDDGIKQSNTNINWRRLGTSRNIIFHDYDVVDMEIIASVVFKDISALRLIKEVDSKDIYQAVTLVGRVFDEFVGVDYSEQGKNTFKNGLESIFEEYSSGMTPENRKIWACYQGGQIIGVIAIRDTSHISLLFVDKQNHKKGVARLMFNYVLNEIKKTDAITQITVHSSAYAVKAYECLGFVRTGEQQEKDGILFTPMIRTV